LAKMRHILLTGQWKDCIDLLDALSRAGYLTSVVAPDRVAQVEHDLLIARVSRADAMPAGTPGPWLAWFPADRAELSTRAYQAGAVAAFSEETPIPTILQIVERTLALAANTKDAGPESMAQRRYQRGDVILLELGTVLEIQRGIIALTMVHQDGAEVLLGLCGPEQMLIPHPEDTCFIQLVAHTDCQVALRPWERAVRDAGFPDKVRSRLQQMEAWAAMQSRPDLDQRVLGILSLLSEQFGLPSPQGKIVDVRITHTQLAAAVGATRTTITRTLGDLRRRGIISSIQTKDGERFCLTQWESGHHSWHGPGETEENCAEKHTGAV
jgi:CRP-like cAMP-binding protein